MTLAELQGWVREQILADPWFAGLPVVIEARGDFETELEVALNRLGLSVVIATPTSEQTEQASRVVAGVGVVLAVAEIPATNSTGKSAMEAMDRLIPLLHWRRGPGMGGHMQFKGHEAEDIPGMAAYRARFSVTIVYSQS